MSSKRSKLAIEELKSLRESKRTRLSSYKVQEAEDIFEEIDDEEHRKRLRARLDEPEFVVDDRGEGYVENGMDDWGEDDVHESDESEDDRRRGGRPKGSRAKEKDKEVLKNQEGSINKYFNARPAQKKQVSTVEQEGILDDILKEFDEGTAEVPAASTSRAAARGGNFRKPQAPSSPSIRPIKAEEYAQFERITAGAEELKIRNPIPSSPPSFAQLASDSFNDDVPAEDATMNDVADEIPVIPPSDRKSHHTTIKVEEEEDEDEELTMKPIAGFSKSRAQAVNVSAQRPKPVAPILDAPKSVQAPKIEAVDASSWKSITAGLQVTTDSSASHKANVADILEEDGSFLFFWMDFTEINGALCLFGKVRVKGSDRYASMFLKVDGIMRKFFFLPREFRRKGGRDTNEEVEMDHVYEEVDKLLALHGINDWKSKPCTRKYAFELPDVPRESDYLKVLYPYDKPALPIETSGETFSRVFGTNTLLFEQFVLARNIMGPCWLEIKNPAFDIRGASWCKLEARVPRLSDITMIQDGKAPETPTLTLMSVALRTKLNYKDNKQEIVLISGRVYDNVSLDSPVPAEELICQTFTFIRPPNKAFPASFEREINASKGAVKTDKTENGILQMFLAKLQFHDPDVLIGHNLEDIVHSTLLHRLKDGRINNWHRVGRMKRNAWPNLLGRGALFAERQLMSGRLMCDLSNDLGKSLMNKCQSWSLTEMCDLVLGKKRIDLDSEAALKQWANTSKGLMDFISHCETDTFFVSAIAIKVQILPLAKQLTNLAGNSWARTMSGTRAERNEYILLHEFTRGKYICPDKMSQRGKGNSSKEMEENEGDDGEAKEGAKKKDKFKGGLVLEPERGLYDKFILVMDFNSLYPSIIQEYNICFTTVERLHLSEDTVPEVPDQEHAQGILPKLISTLVQRRRQVKGLMKDKRATPTQLSQWDIKQQALKLTANSMYGCLGYDRSRFYARPLAMLTTFKGREILSSTKDLAESMQLRVIYGDTDSVMINTNVDNYLDAYKIGTDFKKSVNERYRLLEIDIDNVFQRLLLHSKKKYAALNYSPEGKTTMEIKGLDMRRREYCQLSKDVSGEILKEILSGDETDIVVERIHDYLRLVAEKIRNHEFPATKYIIFTKLSKEPEAYPGGNSMPQVQVALRRKKAGEHVRAGEVISYIITEGSDPSPAMRGRAPQELKADSSLKPDREWYLVKQIFPPIERLCGPIDGTDAIRIAECLGLDIKKYQINHSVAQTGKEIHPLESTLSDEDRFQSADRLKITCLRCTKEFDFEGLSPDNKSCLLDGFVCPLEGCGNVLSMTSIMAQVERNIRQHTTRYYEQWLVCDDVSCGNRTRQMSVYGKRCLGPKCLAAGCLGVMRYEYTDKMLYNQLLYFQSLFDVEKAKAKATGSSKEKMDVLAEGNRARLDPIFAIVDQYLKKCGRQWVQMDNIFSFV